MIKEQNKDSDSEDENDSLFSLNILGALTPNNFKMPTMDPYDGITDPRVHLLRYVRHMEMT